MSDADRPLALGLLDVLVGEWTQQVTGHGDPTGTITFEWALGDTYLLQRSTLPPPTCFWSASNDCPATEFANRSRISRAHGAWCS